MISSLLKQLSNSKRNPFWSQPLRSSSSSSSSSSLDLNTKKLSFDNRTCSTENASSGDFPKSDLYYGITLLRSAKTSVSPILDQWVNEGNEVVKSELRHIIRTLRNRKRYAQALQVSEWMSSQRHCSKLENNRSLHLDLIGKVHGVSAAESYFNSWDEKSESFYGALLSCYVEKGLVDKSLSHYSKMKELGIAKSSLTYNLIISLYQNISQHEKICDVLADMRNNNVVPDNVNYRMCIKSYMSRSDVGSMEKLLEEMEGDPRLLVEWRTYANIASVYVKLDLREKALQYLTKAEDRINRDGRGYNYLITLHASLGNKSEMMKLWEKQKSVCKRQVNTDYMTMMGSLLKLGDLEEAEVLFKEWEQSGNLYDFRVPNVLLIGYTQKGLIEKGEKMLQELIDNGKTPLPNSWSIISAGYLAKQDMKMALECMKKSLLQASECPDCPDWEPKPTVVSKLLEWLGEEGDIEEVDAFVRSLNSVIPMNKEMYHTLIKANIRHERGVDQVLQNMKADNIEEDEETKKILAALDSKIGESLQVENGATI